MAHSRRDVLAGGLGMMASPLMARGRRGASTRPLFVNTLGALTDEFDVKVMKAGIDPALLQAVRASGLAAVNVTLAVSSPGAHDFENTLDEIADWDELIRRHAAYFLKISQASDIEAAHRAGKLGIIYGFQNTSRIGDDLDRIDQFHDRGLRIIQLTYNMANPVGGGVLAPERGLTDFGHRVVERLNARRIMVDLSHSGTKTCLDAIAASRQPISINHTGCRALVDVPRNKTDEELRLAAGKGGYIGIYLNSFLSVHMPSKADDLIAHIEHAIQICGEDHVGIGSDNDSPFAAHDSAIFTKLMNEQIMQRRAAGMSAPGENPGFLPFLPDLQGPDLYRQLAVKLRERGHSQSRVAKILGGNFMRYADAIWRA